MRRLLLLPVLAGLAGCATPHPDHHAAVPFIAQENGHCGEAALAMILQFRGRPVDPARLRARLDLPALSGTASLLIAAESRDEGLAARVSTFATPDEAGRMLLMRAGEAGGLTARGWTRTLRLARTIADLDGSTGVLRRHVADRVAIDAAAEACQAPGTATLNFVWESGPNAYSQSFHFEPAARADLKQLSIALENELGADLLEIAIDIEDGSIPELGAVAAADELSRQLRSLGFEGVADAFDGDPARPTQAPGLSP